MAALRPGERAGLHRGDVGELRLQVAAHSVPYLDAAVAGGEGEEVGSRAEGGEEVADGCGRGRHSPRGADGRRGGGSKGLGGGAARVFGGTLVRASGGSRITGARRVCPFGSASESGLWSPDSGLIGFATQGLFCSSPYKAKILIILKSR